MFRVYDVLLEALQGDLAQKRALYDMIGHGKKPRDPKKYSRGRTSSIMPQGPSNMKSTPNLTLIVFRSLVF